MGKKKNTKLIKDTKYFKWGLTLFLAITASVCFIYVVYNANELSKGFSKLVKVLTPILDGFLIAYLINPIMRFFENRVMIKYCIKRNIYVTKKMKKRFRAESLIISLIIVISLLYAFFGTVLPQIYSSMQSIIIHFPTYYNNVIATINRELSSSDIFIENDVLELVNRYSGDINNFFSQNVIPNISDLLVKVSNGLLSAVNALLNLIIGLIVAIYLLLSKEKYIGLLKKMVYSLFDREKANDLMVDFRYINKTFGGFLVGKIIDSIIMGILCFIGLSILHTPYAVLVSVIVGITNIIPFFGPYLGAIPSALLILLVNPRQCLYFIIFILILQQIDGNIIGPAVLGNSIGISSFWIIFSITLFGGFFGIFGMLVGVPIFACCYGFIRRRVDRRLLRKSLPTATVDYANADYIDSDKKIVNITTDEDSNYMINPLSPIYKRYMELNPSEFVEGTKKAKKKWYRRLYILIKDYILKLNDNIHNAKKVNANKAPKDIITSPENKDIFTDENDENVNASDD